MALLWDQQGNNRFQAIGSRQAINSLARESAKARKITPMSARLTALMHNHISWFETFSRNNCHSQAGRFLVIIGCSGHSSPQIAERLLLLMHHAGQLVRRVQPCRVMHSPTFFAPPFCAICLRRKAVGNPGTSWHPTSPDF